MLVAGIVLLLFAACVMLYQADTQRSTVACLRRSLQARQAMRAAAVFLCAMTLILVSRLQGWERGIPLWLGLFSVVFVAGLFLAAQKPGWHGPAGTSSLIAGLAFTTGGIIS